MNHSDILEKIDQHKMHGWRKMSYFFFFEIETSFMCVAKIKSARLFSICFDFLN